MLICIENRQHTGRGILTNVYLSGVCKTVLTAILRPEMIVVQKVISARYNERL